MDRALHHAGGGLAVAKERFTTREIIAALLEARGVKAQAARLLGCNRNTVERYISLYPTVQEAYAIARAELVDLAESKLVDQLEAGEWPAIRYTLSTLGKDRGYVERSESAVQAKVEAEIEHTQRLEGFTTAELLDIVIQAQLSGRTSTLKPGGGNYREITNRKDDQEGLE